MMATLLFTLSRGAWLAFAVTAAVVGFATNRGLVVLLVVVFLVGYRWAPARSRDPCRPHGESGRTVRREPHSKSRSTIPRHCASSNGSRFRRCSWRVPSGAPASGRIRERLHRETGIFRPAHATMVQIGTEMGALGPPRLSGPAGNGRDRVREARATGRTRQLSSAPPALASWPRRSASFSSTSAARDSAPTR